MSPAAICAGDARESFELALGADEGIGIERKLVKRYTDSSGLIGNRTRVNYEFRIDVRNNHKNAERAVRGPVAGLAQRADPGHLAGTKAQEIKREDDGKLKWDWTLQPGEKRSAALKFSVEYPGPGGQRPRLALAKAPAAA